MEGLSLTPHSLTIPCTLLRTIQIGWNLFQILEKIFQRIFLLKEGWFKGQNDFYVDADHAHDLVTRRSITGILVMLNNIPIRWISKCQKTVETSTYGSELVASRVAT
jgi:hypothetical protein